MSSAEFVVRIATEPGVLLVSVHVSRTVMSEEVDAFMSRLATAVAEVETIDQRLMEELLFENRQVIQLEATLGVVVWRKFSDPDYPRRIDCELRKVNINPVTDRWTYSGERFRSGTAEAQ